MEARHAVPGEEIAYLASYRTVLCRVSRHLHGPVTSSVIVLAGTQ